MISFIEGGNGWMNVWASIPNVNTNQYALSTMQRFVDNNQLGLFAMSFTEQLLLANNNITTLAPPFYSADRAGYNAGNYLFGLYHDVDE